MAHRNFSYRAFTATVPWCSPAPASDETEDMLILLIEDEAEMARLPVLSQIFAVAEKDLAR